MVLKSTALKRATKSIPLSGGIVEEVDDFLLEPAGMAFSKNARFTKKDLAEKARALGANAIHGVPFRNSKINGFWSDAGDRLAVIGHDEVSVSEDGGTTWTDTDQDCDIMGIERILTTQTQAGGLNFSWAPIGIEVDETTYAINGYAVAFERVTHNTSTRTTSRNVVMQVYNADGRLLHETEDLGENSPIVLESAEDNQATVLYCTGVSGTLKSRIMSLTAIGSSTSSALDVQQYCQYYTQATGTYDGNNFSDLRMGYAQDMKANNSALVAYSNAHDIIGCYAYKVEATGQIKFAYLNDGIPTGTPITAHTDTGAITTRSVLDVSLSVTTGHLYLLYGEFKNVANNWNLQVDQWDIASGTLNATYACRTGSTDIPINGSVREARDGKVFIAVTNASGYPDQTMQDTSGTHNTRWYNLTGGDWSGGAPSLSGIGTIYSHRLVSNIACDMDDEAGFVIQQWDNWNPSDETKTGGNPQVYAICPVAKKPVTSILVKTQTTLYTDVIATFDAGQCKAQPVSNDEQCVHKSGNLYYFDNGSLGSADHNRWHYGNRIVQTAADTLYWMDRNVGAANPNSDARIALLTGESRFSVYRVSGDVRTYWTNFPDGAFLGTSVPAWYDGGKYIMSASPLDSPEITGATTSGDGISYMAYADMGTGSEGPKVYQAVWVFSDASGRVHRSAPSIPIYLGKLDHTITTTDSISLFVTPPVTLQRDGGSFSVEIYESWPGGVPQLAATQEIRGRANLGGSIPTVVSFAVNLLPDGTIGADVVDYRAAKTLYTQGNVLASDPWPNFDVVIQNGRRLFGHSIGDPSTIYYSKTFEQNIAPEFSASLTVTLGNQTITALASIDDKVIVFTKTGCWLMYGTGPDNTGANGDFFLEKMTFQVGCNDQDSIITFQDGIAFYSNTTKKFYVLTRDLQLLDIGDAIQTLTSHIDDVSVGVAVPHDEELRWYCTLDGGGDEFLPAGGLTSPAQPTRPWMENTIAEDQCCFAYSFKYAKWSVRSYDLSLPLGASDVYLDGCAVITNNQVATLTLSGCKVEQDAVWEKAELMQWHTPWIKVNQLQDFGRFYGATFLGKYLSSWDDPGTATEYEAGDLQITVRYDYEGQGADTDVFRFRANQDFDPADGDRLQFRIRPKRQKCQAIKFEIEEIPTTAIEVWEPTYTTGRGFVLSAVDLHYGAKGGSGDKNLGSLRRKG